MAGLTAAFAWSGVLVTRHIRKATPIMRFGPLLAGAAAFAFLFFLPKILGFQKDTQLFLPCLLVCIHSKQILETTPETVLPSVHNPGVPDEIFHEELKKAYRTALEQPSGYPTLGFQSDYILYLSGFFSNIQRKEGSPAQAEKREHNPFGIGQRLTNLR